jgi:lysyl-tRNA synthetase class 2
MLGKEDLKLRAELWNGVISQVHAFFQSKNYLEVRTPVLVKSPGMEPNLDPVGVDVRLIDGTKHRGGLITSPEYSMKKLLGSGLDKIYTLTPVFRNVEKMGERWSVEFTMLEWYRTNADYNECMKETEELVDMILGPEKAGLSTPHWPRISYVDEYTKHFGIHPADETLEPSKVADRFQFEVMPKLEAQYPRFFLTEYPVAEAALAQKNADGRSAQRFEGYVNGIEICNGFTELVDAVEQRKRFEIEAEERRAAGKEVFPIDEELLSGLSSVPSPTFGNALGIDRLIMLKAGTKDIDSIHLFPPSTRF